MIDARRFIFGRSETAEIGITHVVIKDNDDVWPVLTCGANPERVATQLKEKLGHNAVALQMPIGLEADFTGVIDLVTMQALYFDGDNGQTVRSEDIPNEYKEAALEKREALIDAASMFSDELTEAVLEEKEISAELLMAALRTGTLARELTPV